MKNNKILITGISGLLGSNIAYCLKDEYQLYGWYLSYKVYMPYVETYEVDISNEKAVNASLSKINPDIIIHCASLTNLDACEKNPDLTYEVNVQGTSNIVKWCCDKNTRFIYISTDAVYDGNIKNSNEDETPKPINIYGKTKYEAELLLKEIRKSLILRTNIFGWNIREKYSLAEWVISSLERGCRINCFNDVFFSSIYTFEFAKILNIIIKKELNGLYNLASSNSMSKYEFALCLADTFGLDKNLIEPISIEEHSFGAPRGRKLTMNVEKISSALDMQMPSVEECIDRFFKDYNNDVDIKIKDLGYNGKWYPSAESISYGRQSLNDDDIASVVNVLKSSHLTQGSKIGEFEERLIEYTGAKHAVVFNSGTSALHAACFSAGIKAGDEFITSPNTFVASANCGIYCGAQPVFADIEKDTYNMSPARLKEKLGKKVKVVIPVHFAGQSCNMEVIRDAVNSTEKLYSSKIFIIEDASHALGSFYKGKKVCSCTYSDMAVTSFHPVKHITTGEGGAVFTNSKDLAERLRLFRSHGITNNMENITSKKEAMDEEGNYNPWYYEQQILGHNYRMTDIQCALGISQLEKIDYFMKKRRKLYHRYNSAFKSNSLIKVPHELADCFSNWHLYVLKIDFGKAGIKRADLMRKLKQAGIITQIHYIPVHTQPFYREKFNTSRGDFPVAENYYRQCLSIPFFPGLSVNDVEMVIKEITKVLKKIKNF